jgi:hypothetical protein
MQNKALTEDEIDLLMDGWQPEFPTELEVHNMQRMIDGIVGCSDALTSHLLNRVHVWLAPEGDAWQGDERINATWAETGKKKTCVLTDRDGGSEWRISWFVKYLGRDQNISLERRLEDGSFAEVAEGVIEDGKRVERSRIKVFTKVPTTIGSVYGFTSYGAFEDICDFGTLISPSMPAELKAVTKHTVTYENHYQLESLEPVLVHDGGLPGELSYARHKIISAYGTGVGAEWIASKQEALADGLRAAGAVWGSGYLTYNDLDYHCCVVDMGDGKTGFFNDNTATCADVSAYVAWFDKDETGVTALSSYVFRKDEEIREAMPKVMSGETPPDFRYTFSNGFAEVSDNRMGEAAVVMLFWQFLADNTFALEDGKMNTNDGYWMEPKPVPSSTRAPRV